MTRKTMENVFNVFNIIGMAFVGIGALAVQRTVYAIEPLSTTLLTMLLTIGAFTVIRYDTQLSMDDVGARLIAIFAVLGLIVSSFNLIHLVTTALGFATIEQISNPLGKVVESVVMMGVGGFLYGLGEVYEEI